MNGISKGIEISVEIAHDAIARLLIAAIEGGSNYWYRIEDMGRQCKGESFYDRCFSEEGVKISDFVGQDHDENQMKIGTVNNRTLRAGLEIMAEFHPRHFADILGENADAVTGDVFLQCVVLGEVIYG